MSTFTPSSVSASSQQTGYEAANAVDGYAGSGNSRWAAAAASPQSLTRDEGSAKVATWYAITPGGAAEAQDPADWTLLGSNDPTFTTGVVTLDTRSVVKFAGNGKTFTFTNSTAFRYYRLAFTEVFFQGSTPSVAEFVVGDQNPPSWGLARRTPVAGVNGTFSLSVDYTPAVNGYITHVHYPHNGGTGAVNVYVSTTSGTLLASATDSNQALRPALTSVPVELATPLAVTAGTTYRVAAYVPGTSYHVGSSIGTALVDGDLTAVANSPRYDTVDNRNPPNTGGAWYGVAPKFVRELPSTGTPVSVAAPVLAGTGAVLAPTVLSGSSVAVSAPVLAGSGAVLAPTVGTGSGVRVDVPTLAGSGAVLAPSVDLSASVTVALPTLAGSGAVLAPSVGAGSALTVEVPTLAGAGALVAPAVSTIDSLPGVVYLTAPSPAHGALASFEVFTPASEVLFLSAPASCGGTLRIHPVAVPVPAGISDRPIERKQHLMAPKTPANPRKMGDELRAAGAGDDGYNYPIVKGSVGRLRVFASGIDITYLMGAPTTVSEWSFAKPFGPQAASFTVPLPEWNYPGPYAGPHGNLPIFWGDAPVEICLEDEAGNLRHLWEGFTAEESDTAAPGQTGVTFNCEGTFQQAAHWLWDPPAVMDERDYGHVIADALNSVPNRRWAKIKRFSTGRFTIERGDSSQSVLAYAADLMGKVFDDDGNALRLRRVGPYRYELAFSQPVTVPNWSFTKGSPGFDMTLARPHSARRDMVFARGIAPDGGFWMGRKFPGLAAAAVPVYPMAGFANIGVGTTDSDTTTGNGVSTWQRRMRELGYPVTVDGVMNSADTKWVVRIQEDRGITADGSLGPQTWSATWEGPTGTPETDTVRLPLAVKVIARQYDRDASGAIIRENPLFDKMKILHATPEVDAGTNMRKSTFRPIAAQIRAREASPGYVGTLTATGVDPKQPNASRLFITEGDNVQVDGHHWDTVVQVADVTHTPTTTRMTVDSGARGQALVDAIMYRQRDVRRSLSGKSTRVTDRGTLNSSQLGQFESESPAGKYSRTAINGDSGLWTVRCIYVAEQGLARFRLTSSPNAEIVTTIWDRPVKANFIAARVPDPLTDDSGWYDHEKELAAAGLINVAGTPGSPGGYYPRQKSDGGALTGEQAVGNLSMKSKRGGFFWVAVYTSRSTFVEGEFEPEVPTS